MLNYPVSRRDNFVETLHGTDVADPYRWLEDLDTDETRCWVERQNQLTDSYLAKLPLREQIRERLEEVWNYTRMGIPEERSGRYFFTRNDGLQNQNILYWMDSLDGKPNVLLDPNELSVDGTVALIGYSPSDDGQFLAYGLATAGSDWQEWHIRDVKAGRDLDEQIEWAKTWSVGWDREGEGFYYSRFDKPPKGEEYKSANFFQKIYYHRKGTPQSDDILIYHRPDHRDWYLSGYVTEDGRYLIIRASEGTSRENGLFYQDLHQTSPDVANADSANRESSDAVGALTIELFNQFDAAYSLVGNDGPTFYIHTNHSAPRGRIVAVDINTPQSEAWRTIVPECSDTIEQVSLLNGSQLVVRYLHNAHSRVEIYDLNGQAIRSVDLPGIGTVSGFHGQRECRETFFQFSSFSQPGAIYRVNVETGENHLFHQPEVDFDPGEFITEQIFYKSKDGTQVPMFLSYKRGTDRNQPQPTFLYGYGGFNIPLTPNFSARNLVWMEMGGIFVQANLRGGGEYGKQWYKDGTKEQKQNVFDDFIAAAEHLIRCGATTTDKLAIGGGSNGGLLVGACMTQRPDLFGACWAAVGVLDMLRFHLFTVGWGWISDYGSPDEPSDFHNLLTYSPYHNLTQGMAYPATLITTGDHDDRVFPAHSFKFAAALQHATRGDAPNLIRITTRAGHGAGKPTSMLIEESADIWTFLIDALKMEPMG
ncbi:MAG: prolyl oligopeptidase family serine peptidase [Chloroflexota bacterium]